MSATKDFNENILQWKAPTISILNWDSRKFKTYTFPLCRTMQQVAQYRNFRSLEKTRMVRSYSIFSVLWNNKRPKQHRCEPNHWTFAVNPTSHYLHNSLLRDLISNFKSRLVASSPVNPKISELMLCNYRNTTKKNKNNDDRRNQ